MKVLFLTIILIVGALFIECAINETNRISIEEAVTILEEARYSHEYYVEHPDKTNTFTGDVEHNQKWIDDYNKIINLLKELENE